MTEVLKEQTEQRTRHHPKSTNASPEHARALAGIITLNGPAPSSRFLQHEHGGEDEPTSRAGH
ncbi:MAG: hypothetical protein ACR2PL_20320 [Dehalococcoidia bacterium]